MSIKDKMNNIESDSESLSNMPVMSIATVTALPGLVSSAEENRVESHPESLQDSNMPVMPITNITTAPTASTEENRVESHPESLQDSYMPVISSRNITIGSTASTEENHIDNNSECLCDVPLMPIATTPAEEALRVHMEVLSDVENADSSAIGVAAEPIGSMDDNSGCCKSAFKILLFRQAKEGMADSQYDIATMYMKGRDVARNEQEAVMWYRKAAEQNHPKALYELGRCTEKGIGGVEKNINDAVGWYRKAADQGDLDAAFVLACCYFEGRGVEKNMSEAVARLRKAAEQGHLRSQFWLAQTLIEGTGTDKNVHEGVDWCRKATEKGYALAQVSMGIWYLKGLGEYVKCDPQEAVRLFQKAADQGNATAQFQLAECYMHGTGVEKSNSKAAKWYRSAGYNGNHQSQYLLGCLCMDGRGVPLNKTRGYKWLHMAALGGHADAQLSIGRYLQQGKIVSKDIHEAVTWFQKSAAQGIVDAQLYLAQCLAEGNGTGKDLRKAAYWYLKAAKKGYASAQFHLAELIEKNEGQDRLIDGQNEADALAWYRSAANLGNADAQYALACRYTAGKGLDINVTEAFKWYSKSATQGNANAKYQLGMCFMKGAGVIRNESKAIRWLYEAAETNSVKALYQYGICLFYGIGCSKNENRAVQYFERAVDRGSLEAVYELSYCLLNGIGTKSDVPRAIRLLIEAKNSHRSFIATNLLGMCYEQSRLIADHRLAFSTYQDAMDLGSKKAISNVARLLEIGLGTDKDEVKALLCYLKVVQLDVHGDEEFDDAFLGLNNDRCTIAIRTTSFKRVNALFRSNMLNMSQEMSALVLQEFLAIFAAIEKATIKKVDGELPDLLVNLALCYHAGIGVKQDDMEANQWCQKARAALSGFQDPDPETMNYIGIIGYSSQSIESTISIFNKAAVKKFAPACYNLACCSSRLDADLSRKQFLQLANDMHFAPAQLVVGLVCLGDDLRIDQSRVPASLSHGLMEFDVAAVRSRMLHNITKARTWLSAAAIQNYQLVFKFLDQLSASSSLASDESQPSQIADPADVPLLLSPVHKPDADNSLGAFDGSLCAICYYASREIVFLPCRHFYCCKFCAKKEEMKGYCSICKDTISSVMHIYMP